MPTATKIDMSVFLESVADNEAAKRRFHRQSAAVLRELARHLGYKAGDFDLRHNQRGIAVSGEIILHSDTLYVHFEQNVAGLQWGFMWRICRGRRDFRGRANQWIPWDRLNNLESVAKHMLAAMG